MTARKKKTAAKKTARKKAPVKKVAKKKAAPKATGRVAKKKVTKKTATEIQTEPFGQFVNKVEFARWNGVSARQVGNWENDGMPSIRVGRGRAGNKIDSALAQRWLEERRLAKNAPSEGTYDRERLRLVTEQANEKAIKNALERGELIKSEHAQEFAMEAVARLAGNLSGLPGRLANELARTQSPAECRELIKREVDRTRQQFAADLEELGESCQDRRDSGEDNSDTG